MCGGLAFLRTWGGLCRAKGGYPRPPSASPYESFFATGEKSVQLVMEYVPLGSLRDYLPRHDVGLGQLLLFAQQICEVGGPPPRFPNLLL